MKILVIGGSGFIGTRLVGELLNSRHDVRIFDKEASQAFPDLVIRGDVRDPLALIKAARGMDLIFNLAAEHNDNVMPVSLYDEVNVGGALNTVKAAKANNIDSIIFTSTVAVYGLNKKNPDENSPLEPFNAYGKSKLAAEKTFLKWSSEAGSRTVIIVRPSVIFGENHRGNVYRLIKQIRTGFFLMVGKGDNKKSMGYVGNIACFLAGLIDRKESCVVNYCDKPDLSSSEIVDEISAFYGIKIKRVRIATPVGLLAGCFLDLASMILRRPFAITYIRIKKFCSETTICTRKLKDFGFSPPHSLKEGLIRTLENDEQAKDENPARSAR